jgi:hypothetical protein
MQSNQTLEQEKKAIKKSLINEIKEQETATLNKKNATADKKMLVQEDDDLMLSV